MLITPDIENVLQKLKELETLIQKDLNIACETKSPTEKDEAIKNIKKAITTLRTLLEEKNYSQIPNTAIGVIKYIRWLIQIQSTHKKNEEIHQEKYDELACFLQLYTAIFFQKFYQTNQNSMSEEDFFTNFQRVVTSVEINHPKPLQNNEGLQKLHKDLADTLRNNLTKKEKPGERLYADELESTVKYKNAANIKIIYNAESNFIFGTDEQNFHLLINDILSLQNSSTINRKQYIFYHNTALGHAQLLDVEWDAKNNKFLIISLESAGLSLQHELLTLLTHYFNTHKLTYSVIACKADLQKDSFSCPMYSYYFSTQIAKLNFSILENHFQKKDALVSQPMFGNTEISEKSYPAVPNTRWLNPKYLPKSIILSSQSTTWITNLLKEEAPKNLDKCKTFISDKRKKLAEKTALRSKSLTELTKIFNTENSEQAIRRAGAGSGKDTEAGVLIEKSLEAGTDINVSASGKNALQWSLEKKCYKRTRMLIKAGATIDENSKNKMLKEASHDEKLMALLKH